MTRVNVCKKIPARGLAEDFSESCCSGPVCGGVWLLFQKLFTPDHTQYYKRVFIILPKESQLLEEGGGERSLGRGCGRMEGEQQ